MRISDWSSDVCSSDLLPPRRHSGHLDSMLDDPELLRSRTIRTFKQDGCLRIQPLTHLGFFHSGRQMAAAAHLRVKSGARCNSSRSRQICRHRDRSGPGCDGSLPECFHDAVSHPAMRRSEEHTSELQSLMRISYAVFCLKKKKKELPQTPNKILTLKLKQ